jgi:hypothetical protein
MVMSIVDGVWYLSRERENDYCFLILCDTGASRHFMEMARPWQRYLAGAMLNAKVPQDIKDT